LQLALERPQCGSNVVRREQAQGVLIAALCMLAGHFSYAEAA
jgi:hypothetical protein